ncbi:hypothetical protein GCU56_09065 [Geodermatophilus sabuli]|uniref:Uncharacterized protein n=1 Tax=Geodermatophilus sabuli TaxID=1564158 RepID=A0A7K3VZE8_9ACTN|nr:hypothetical protein [Geodermatophilus sabuli]NEK58021.1 hypothetical protein [Geodermatophilus sabuli]
MPTSDALPFRSLFVVGAALSTVLVTGCGADDTASSASSPAASSRASSAASSAAGDEPVVEGDTCEQLRSAGANGASFGPVQALLPKADLLDWIDGKLTPLQQSDPAADVADAWATAQSYLEEYQAAAQALPDGGTVDDPALFDPGDEVEAAQQELTDWWFDTCA